MKLVMSISDHIVVINQGRPLAAGYAAGSDAVHLQLLAPELDESDVRDALDALERIFVQRELHGDLIDVLRRRVEAAGDPAARKAHLQRIARLYENELEDETEAIGDEDPLIGRQHQEGHRQDDTDRQGQDLAPQRETE